MKNNINEINNNFSIFTIRQSLSNYLYTSKDILYNILNITNSNIYSKYTYKNIFKYYSMAFFIGYIILFLPITFKINGSITVPILFLKSTFVVLIVAIIYTIPIYFIKKEFLFKKILLTLILAYSFYFPFFCLSSIPMFLDMNIVNSDFFIGGGNSEIPKPTTENYYFLLYIVSTNIVNNMISSIILPTIWLAKILKIKWWKILLIILIFSTFAVKFILFINPIILNITKDLDKIVNIIG